MWRNYIQRNKQPWYHHIFFFLILRKLTWYVAGCFDPFFFFDNLRFTTVSDFWGSESDFDRRENGLPGENYDFAAGLPKQ